MSREIQLSRGLVTIVDDEAYEWLSRWKWSALKSKTGAFYAMRSVWDGERNSYVLMHRLITEAPKGQVVDHINGNPLDNRRENIRVCQQVKNCLNRRGYLKKTSSQYKGVWWHQGRMKWVANFRGKYIGIFREEIDAARAYDKAAILYSPAFARPNFPQGEQ